MKNRNSWNRYRSTNLLIGFIISISICLMAFNYTTYDERSYSYEPPVDIEVEAVEIRRTAHPKPEKKIIPIPKKIELANEFLPIEDVIIAALDLMPVELDSNTLLESDTSSLFATDISQGNTNTPTPPPLPDLSQTDVPDIAVRFAQHMAYYGDCNEADISVDDKKSCSDKAFISYLRANIKYPAIAKENGIEGTVFIEIIIGKDGSLESAKIIRDVDGGCGKEALRVVKKMGKWSAARQGGKNVKLIMTLPVYFKLG